METCRVDRYEKFGQAIDAIKKRTEAKIGKEDADYVRRMNTFSRVMEVAGRGLIHFSLDPVTFGAGVFALWIHKQLQAAEIGHTALHGAFDKLEGAESFRSDTFSWDTPIDEESWRYGHNVRHHQYTNIAGKDPDVHFGNIRLNEDAPKMVKSALDIPVTLFAVIPNFGFVMNAHFTGLVDVYVGNGGEKGRDTDFLPDRSRRSVLEAHKKAFRKYLPYYFKNYVFFPALAGPFFWKVLLGNWLAEAGRDIYLAVTIYCGHVGEDVESFPEGSRAHGRGEWYAMQVAAANNFQVPWLISVLCGALDHQIEHHMFPKFPTNRLREVAPEVKKACEEHGIPYKTDTWPRTLSKVWKRVTALNRP